MRYYRAFLIMQGTVMTDLQRIGLATLCACFLAGCGSSSEPPQPPPVKDTAFGDLVGTMDKARGVQDTVDAQKQQADRQLEAAEGQSSQ